jgi:hypothetical protein
VVQLREGTPLTPAQLSGRVEPLVSSRSALFASLTNSVAFMAQVLYQPRTGTHGNGVVDQRANVWPRVATRASPPSAVVYQRRAAGTVNRRLGYCQVLYIIVVRTEAEDLQWSVVAPPVVPVRGLDARLHLPYGLPFTNVTDTTVHGVLRHNWGVPLCAPAH